MNLHMGSVVKSAGLAAAVAILLGLLLWLIPLPWLIVGFGFICGGFLIPVGAGIGYGYFAPGEEEIKDSAAGGALAGGASGLLLGIFAGLSATVTSAVSQNVGGAVITGAVLTLMCVCGLGFMGLVLGALGGAIWPLIQQRTA